MVYQEFPDWLYKFIHDPPNSLDELTRPEFIKNFMREVRQFQNSDELLKQWYVWTLDFQADNRTFIFSAEQQIIRDMVEQRLFPKDN